MNTNKEVEIEKLALLLSKIFVTQIAYKKAAEALIKEGYSRSNQGLEGAPTVSDLMSIEVKVEGDFLTKESAQHLVDIYKCFKHWENIEKHKSITHLQADFSEHIVGGHFEDNGKTEPGTKCPEVALNIKDGNQVDFQELDKKQFMLFLDNYPIKSSLVFSRDHHECDDFADDVIAKFGGTRRLSVSAIEDVISHSKLWKHQVTRPGLQRDKRHLAQAIHDAQKGTE